MKSPNFINEKLSFENNNLYSQNDKMETQNFLFAQNEKSIMNCPIKNEEMKNFPEEELNKNIIIENNNKGNSQVPQQNKLPPIYRRRKIIKILRKLGNQYHQYIKKIKYQKLNLNIKHALKLINKRKKKGNKKTQHTKNSIDNLMKKIQNSFLKILINSYNKILVKQLGNKKYKLKKLSYKETSNLKRESVLNLLNMKIEDLLKKIPISPKYKKSDNEKIVDNILKLKNEKIRYIFNLTFNEWIDIITKKAKPIYEDIEFDGIDLLLKKIFKEKSKYFWNYIYLIYNYPRWFYCKKKRNNSKK